MCAYACCRQWLVITTSGCMVTGRQEPRLVLVSLSCQDGQVCLSGPDMEELYFSVPQPDCPVVNCRYFTLAWPRTGLELSSKASRPVSPLSCRIFKEDVQGRDCGDEASNWLTRYLGTERIFRLVHFEPQMKARKPLEKECIFPQFEVSVEAFPLVWLSATLLSASLCLLLSP